MTAPPSIPTMMALATSLREHGGNTALALSLEEEAARLILSASRATPTPPTDATYRAFLEAWHGIGQPNRAKVTTLHYLAIDAGLEAAIVGALSEESHTIRVRAFGRWLRASHAIRHHTIGGCVWYDRPVMPKP